MLDISAAYLSQLEKGKRDNPSEALVEKAAQVLGISLSQLIPGTPAEQAAGLVPREPAPAPAAAPSAVKSASKKGQADELRAIRAELKALLARLDRLLNE